MEDRGRMADWEMRYDGRTWAVAIGVGAVLWVSAFLLVAGWTSFVEAVGAWQLLAGIGALVAAGLAVLLAVYGRQRSRERGMSDVEAADDARRRDTQRGFGTADLED